MEYQERPFEGFFKRTGIGSETTYGLGSNEINNAPTKVASNQTACSPSVLSGNFRDTLVSCVYGVLASQRGTIETAPFRPGTNKVREGQILWNQRYVMPSEG